MSTERIFGSWESLPSHGKADDIAHAWHALAAQHVGTPIQKLNSGLSQRRHEWTMLMDLYRRAQPKVVLEIGCAQGGTAAGWCMFGQPDALIIMVDRDTNDIRPRPNEPVHPSVATQKMWPMTESGGGAHALRKHNQTVHPISGWSYEDSTFNRVKAILGSKKVDWMFTDSSHEQSMFADEFKLYWPLVEEGGVYCTHDIQFSSHPSVTKWKEWERIKKEEEYSACFEFLSSRADDSLGIGVLIK